MDIGDCSTVELADECCYLEDMLSVDGDADAAVTAKIRSGRFKFRSLASFFSARDVSLLLCGKVYDACVWSCMLHGRETWSLKTENELAPHQAEMRMIRRMCGVKLMDKRSCVVLRQRLEDAVKVVQRNRLRWYGLG